MRRVGKIFVSITFIIFGFALTQNSVYADASATVVGLYPAAEVPIGAHVTFSLQTSGFTNPTYYLVDSFPGGVTTGNLDLSGNFSWTPNNDDVGTHGLTITVSDSQGDSATASQQIVVDGAASVAVQSLMPGSAVSIGTPVSFTAVGSGLLNPTYTVSDSFSYSSMQSYAITASGSFNWTPIAQDIGSHTITVTAKDIYGNTAAASTQISILPTPMVSIAGITPGTSVPAGQAFSFVATSTGLISPTYAVSDAFQGISTSSITITASGKASWAPQYNDIGVHPLTITASDSSGRSATISLSITVSPQLATPSTQTVTPSSTPAPAAIASAPTTPATPATTAPQTSTTKAASSAPTTVASAATPVSVTPPSSTNPALPSTPDQTTAANIAADVTIPSGPPIESIGGFLLGSVINFFASIFKFF